MKFFGIEIIFRGPGHVCAEKVNYHDSKKAAKAVAKQAKMGRTRYAYQCPHCGGYHLTKMEQG